MVIAVRALVLMFLLNSCLKDQAAVHNEEGYKHIAAADIYYNILGSGEPLLIVHGGPGLNHSYLLPQMEPLASNYQLIFYDQRACGKSSINVPPASVSMRGFVEDIEGLRQSLNLDKLHLLAHSWGGLVAMHYALKYPDHLKSLLLINSVSADSEDRARAASLLMARATREDSVDRAAILSSQAFKNNRPDAFEDFFRVLFRSQFYRREFADSLTLSFPENYRESSQMMAHLGNDLKEYNLYPDLAQIKVPTLLVYGHHDPLSELAGPRLHAELPNSQLITLEECGHFPYIERPKEFFRVVSAFIDDCI